jgi:hypothetical protein
LGFYCALWKVRDIATCGLRCNIIRLICLWLFGLLCCLTRFLYHVLICNTNGYLFT